MSTDQNESLKEHLKWMFESEERALNQIASRAGTLIGLIGVEIAVLTKFVDSRTEQVLALLMAMVLMYSGYKLINVFKPENYDGPNIEVFTEQWLKDRDVEIVIKDQLLVPSDTSKSPINQLRIANIRRGENLHAGIRWFYCAQGFGILLLGTQVFQ